MSSLIKPGKLQPGARIGVVSPCYWLEQEKLQRACSIFESLGYEIILGETTKLKHHRYAGTAEQRAEDIMRMFLDDSIDAILCARGGYGSNRVVPLLDYDLIQKHPKIFVGFSDVTAYLHALSERSNMVCFHGPMLSNFGNQTEQYNLDTLVEVLSGKEPLTIQSSADCQPRVLQSGSATAPLCGGNLSLIVERLGTADPINTDGKLLLIEEVGEKYHAFDRMMLQLKNSGCLDAIAGLIVGEMTEMDDPEATFGMDTDGICLSVCEGLNIPIISNFSAGHGDTIATLPIGHEMTLVTNPVPEIRIKQAPVQ